MYAIAIRQLTQQPLKCIHTCIHTEPANTGGLRDLVWGSVIVSAVGQAYEKDWAFVTLGSRVKAMIRGLESEAPWSWRDFKIIGPRKLILIIILGLRDSLAAYVNEKQTGNWQSFIQMNYYIVVQRLEQNDLVMFYSFYVRVSTITAIWTVGHRLRSTPTNGHRFTALGLPCMAVTDPFGTNRGRRCLTSASVPLSYSLGWFSR